MTEMREPTFLILSALADGPKHGYAIIAEALTLSDGRVRLQPGTLYAALDRLTAEGLIADAGDEVVEGRLRHYVKLTAPGTSVLEADIARQRSNVERASARLRAATGRPAVAR